MCTTSAFFAHRQPLLFRPLVFSRAPGCGARRGAARTLGASLGPVRAPWRPLWEFKVAASWLFSRDRFPPSQSQAGRWKPRKTNDQQVLACSTLCNSSHFAWSSGHLAPRAWAPGHLAPRPSSRATAATLRALFFVPRCFGVCTSIYVLEDDKSKYLTNSGGLAVLRDYLC